MTLSPSAQSSDSGAARQLRPRRWLAAALAVCVVGLAIVAIVAYVLTDRGIPADPEHPVLATGSPAPDFALPGVDGQIHKLSDYASAKVLAIVFQCNHCPVSQIYEGRIKKLYEDYRDRGVALVAVNPDSPNAIRLEELGYTDVGDSLADMKIRAAYRHIEYPYLYDGESQKVSMAFGVVATPQIFVFDQQRKLQYQGRLDDNQQESLVKRRDARTVIDALLAGQPAPVAHTALFGCPTKWLSKSSSVNEELTRITAEPVTLDMAGPDVLKKVRANGTGKLVLVNFWATWCGPCVTEFPDLQNTYRMYRARNFDLVTVSSNDPVERSSVFEFLQQMHASSSNLQFATPDVYGLQAAFDPMMGSGVPFSVLIAPNGDVVYQELGAVSLLNLRRAILANLPEPKMYVGQQAYWSGN